MVKKFWPIPILFCLFVYTLFLRLPFLGTLSDWHHQFLTASSLKFATYWYEEGPSKLKWGMIENPDSVEFSDLKSRVPYPSYPSGSIVPLYFLSKLEGKAPSVSFIHHLNTACQLVIGLLLFLMGLRVFSFLPSIWGSLFSLLAGAFYLLLPGPLYFHQNVYFADQAILFWFVLFVFLECYKDRLKAPFIRQLVVLLIGLFTDWLFLSVGLVFGLMHLRGKKTEWKKVSAILAVLVVFVVTYFFQLHELGVLAELKEKFLFRTGISQEGAKYSSHFFKTFWLGHITKQMGVLGPFIILVSFIGGAFLLIRQKWFKLALPWGRPVRNSLIFLVLPPFIHTMLLKNHSAIHDFSALKFAPMFSLFSMTAFSLLLCWIARSAQEKNLLSGPRWSFLRNAKAPHLILIFSLIYLGYIHSRWHKMFVAPTVNFQKEAELVAMKALYNDVIFSPQMEIKDNPPQRLAISKKRVYWMDNLSKMESFIEELKAKGKLVTPVLLLVPVYNCGNFSETVLALLDFKHDQVYANPHKSLFIRLSDATWEKIKLLKQFKSGAICSPAYDPENEPQFL